MSVNPPHLNSFLDIKLENIIVGRNFPSTFGTLYTIMYKYDNGTISNLFIKDIGRKLAFDTVMKNQNTGECMPGFKKNDGTETFGMSFVVSKDEITAIES